MSAAPWSVKGIDPKAREVAKDLARRSGMTLGDWLNSMIMDDEEDDGDVVPMPRRAQAPQTFDRRGRSRRLTDAYADDQIWMRISASVDAIGQRLEAAEQRSTAAIQGVDQAVAGLVRRLDGQEQVGKAYGRRLDDIAEELKEGHRRLRHFEHEAGPKTSESLGKVEGSIGGIASRLYDIEERQRSSVNELRQRMETVEKAAGPGAGSDRLSQVGQRLDEAQVRTSEALRSLERSFADLDRRLRDAEGRVEPEGAREAARFEKLAESLSRQVETNRLDMMRRLDTVETEGRLERIERAVQSMTEQVKASEERSARAVEAMGQEVLRIAQNLNGRVARIETGGVEAADIGPQIVSSVRAEVGRVTQGMEQRLDQRLTAADDRHALALEKLGGEITRISDRLSERIAQSEQRSAQALDEIGRRLSDSSSRIEQRYDRASGELAERMRMSEERTASLIAEARTTMERRVEAPKPAPIATAPTEPDWRAAAFPDSAFPDPEPFPTALPATSYEDDAIFAEQKAWSADLAPPEPVVEATPELDVEKAKPAFEAATEAFDESADHATAETGDAPTAVFGAAPAATVQPAPFGQGFGGADVSDALAATAPDAFDDADDFDGETEFVDQRALRAAAAKGRASANKDAVSAARAAMVQAEAPVKEQRSLLSGLKRAGKSRLQERLDKAKGSGTVGKAFGASIIAVALTAGGVLATNQLTGAGPSLGDLVGGDQPVVQPTALALTDAPRPADLQKAAQLYQQAIAQLDEQEAAGVETLKQAATLGYAPAQLHLAGLYQDGAQGVDIDPTQARAWAKRAADAGDARGMHAYGMYLFDGVGGAQDRGEALAWLKRAADKGLIDSQFNVAKLYETGDTGIAADPTQAFKWYLIAARGGDTDAEAAVDRLRGELPATQRGEARAEADRFQVQPLG